ncbi:hypothetical protein [Motilimonas pumila]|uniref:Uncharacterized protein n=1 Tax=Motilimonas pumila TaxID=2303987 RepID=A0A418YEH0_9GAMM|nr:hypothetical protein [Motilimonas pumila]RJG47519.1 hypothetical protein D1Z90_10285 [Motilimonas pumila]
MNTKWLVVIGIPFAISLIFHLLIASGVLNRLLNISDGFHAGTALGVWLMILYPVMIIGSALLVMGLVQQQRGWHFFLALMVSIGCHFVIARGLIFYNQQKTDARVQASYQFDPQSRPRHDPLRPLAVMEAKVLQGQNGLQVHLVVHALAGVVDGAERQIEVKPDPYPDSIAWGVGSLHDTRTLTPAGRKVYRATVSFTAPVNWHSGIVVVRGRDNILDSRSITMPD